MKDAPKLVVRYTNGMYLAERPFHFTWTWAPCFAKRFETKDAAEDFMRENIGIVCEVVNDPTGGKW